MHLLSFLVSKTEHNVRFLEEVYGLLILIFVFVLPILVEDF